MKREYDQIQYIHRLLLKLLQMILEWNLFEPTCDQFSSEVDLCVF